MLLFKQCAADGTLASESCVQLSGTVAAWTASSVSRISGISPELITELPQV
jgi:hypothetical protein